MKLRDVLEGVRILSGEWKGTKKISGIAYSSVSVKRGFLFGALKGETRDGMDFIHEALGKGAAAVLSEWPKPESVETCWIQVADAREAIALASVNFFGKPADKMTVVGITGTKGKTTIAYLLEEIFKASGFVPGVIGTIEYRYPGCRTQASRTTPESPDLQAMLKDMLDSGVTHCAMEVSSHALKQKRVWGMSYDVAVFSNLSGEHLDYHRTMESYFEAKRSLFYLDHKRNAAVVNADDPWGQKLISELPMRTITFGRDPAAVVRAAEVRMRDDGVELKIDSPGEIFHVQSKLVGNHNVSNILAAAATALAINIPPPDISQGIAALAGVPGRFQKIKNDRGLHIVVDYAHTDNALENLLLTAREFKPRRVILVFGAGGNRDRQKRERMGRVAARLADWTILTSDNPRSEDPQEIIAAIEQGFKHENVTRYDVVPDRREAIAKALASGEKGEYILVAGKGHEDYQIFKDRTIHFSDVEVIEDILNDLGEPEHG